jgi:hypothetical protein
MYKRAAGFSHVYENFLLLFHIENGTLIYLFTLSHVTKLHIVERKVIVDTSSAQWYSTGL